LQFKIDFSNRSAEGKAGNDKVCLHAKVGAPLIAAKEADNDPFQAAEAVVSRETFAASVKRSSLPRDAEFDSTALLVDHYTQLRRYSPTLFDTMGPHICVVQVNQWRRLLQPEIADAHHGDDCQKFGNGVDICVACPRANTQHV
jgi:hypothetical protein